MSVWKEATAGDGRTYYYNAQTRETRWDKPEELDQPDTPATPQHDPAAVDAAWKEATAPDGRVYYYNAITKETKWEAPPGYTRPPPRDARPPAPAFVAGGFEGDNYRPRERRRDDRDRDHGLPPRPGFDRGRGGDHFDPRQENMGFRGPMPIRSDEPEYPTIELAEEAFFGMLRRYKISPDTPWKEALREVVRETEFRAIKDPKEREAAFEKYCQQVKAQEKSKEQERREKLREDFRKMLGTHEDIKHYTRWKTARPIIEREAVFKSANDDNERRQMFDEYIHELQRKHAEDERTQRLSALQELDALLHALIHDADTKWSDARGEIYNNDRFVQEDKFRKLTNVDVLTAFDSHIKALDRQVNETRQREKRLHHRRERQARDQYKKLLSQMRSQGKITANSRWMDFYPLVAHDERYENVLGNPGSRPVDLFWDVVEEEAYKLRSLRNDALDVLENRRYEMKSSTTFADFAEIMVTDPRTEKMSNKEMNLVYDKLMEKIKKRAEDDRVDSERHNRKAIDSLRSAIKHLEPPIRINDSYDMVLARLQGLKEFKALEDDGLRRSTFEKHIRRLKEKEDEVDRERSRRDRDRDRDRDHRNGSRRGGDRSRERDRRHRTRTPEIDAYEADRRKAQADRERQYRKASFGLSPPPRDRRDDRDDRHRRHDRADASSMYDRERRERELERERNYINRADPRDRGRTLDYGDEDTSGSRPGSVKRRHDSDASDGGRRNVKRTRRGHTRTPEVTETASRPESPTLLSGSEEGEIEEV